MQNQNEQSEQDKRRNLYKAFCFLMSVSCVGLLGLNWQQSLVISQLSGESARNSLSLQEISKTNAQLVDKVDVLATDNKNLSIEFRKMREQQQ